MQIVIDMPKERFEKIKALEDRDIWGDTIYIREGTPLPEHYGRLIDAKVACPNHTECVMCPVAIECPICAAPTIIPATKEGE